MKNKFHLFSIVAVMLICSILLISCNNNGGCKKKKEDNITLSNFEDRVEEVELGNLYTISDLSTTGSDGKTYYFDILVKDSNNQKVIVISNQFEIEDEDGYVIELSTKVNNQTLTKKITLTVKDLTPPTISFTSYSIGVTNRLYNLPQVKIIDSSKTTEIISQTIKLKGTDTLFEITDNTFIPTSEGIYLYEVKAKDSENNVGSKTCEIMVRNLPSSNLIEGFDSEISLFSSKFNDQEWLESYEGRNGVLHIKPVDSEKSFYNFSFVGNVDDYPYFPFDSIKISVFVPKHFDLYQTKSLGEATDWLGSLKANSWNEIIIYNFGDLEEFINEATSTSGTQLFWSWTKNTDLYIDYIAYTKSYEIEISSDKEEYKIGDTVNLEFNMPSNMPYSIIVEDPDEEDVSVTNNSFIALKAGVYNVRIKGNTGSQEIISNGSINVLVYDKYRFLPIETQKALIGEEVTISTIKAINSLTKEEISITPTIKVTYFGTNQNINDNKFVPTKAGKYEITYKASYDEINLKYVNYLYVGEGNEDDGYLFDFATQFEESPLISSTLSSSYVEQYEGGQGLLKINPNNMDYADMYFKLPQTKDFYQNYNFNKIIIKMYLTGGTTSCDAYDKDDNWTSIPREKWFDYEINNIGDYQDFINNGVSDNGVKLFFIYLKNNTIYIDNIRFVNQYDIEITTSENKYILGDNLKISTNIPDGISYEIEVRNPNGDLIDIENNSFDATMIGDYLVNVSFNGNSYYQGSKSFIIPVRNQYIVKLSDLPATPYVGDTFVLPNMTVVDYKNDVEVNCAIFKSVTFNGNPIEINDSSFIPTAKGIYKLILSYSVNSNDYQEVIEYRIGNKEASNNGFDFFTDVDLAYCTNDSTTVTWLESYNGADGVLKVVTTDVNEVKFKFNMTKEALEAYDFDILEIRIATDGASDWYNQINNNINIGRNFKVISITKEELLAFDNNFYENASINGSGALIATTWWRSGGVVFYFDSVLLKKLGKPNYDFDTDTSIYNCLNENKGAGSIEYLSEYNGAHGILKVIPVGDPKVYFVSDYSSGGLDSLDWDYLEIKICNDSSTDWYNVIDSNLYYTSSWTTITISKDKLLAYDNNFNKHFAYDGSGVDIVSTYCRDGMIIYIDSITFKKN